MCMFSEVSLDSTSLLIFGFSCLPMEALAFFIGLKNWAEASPARTPSQRKRSRASEAAVLMSRVGVVLSGEKEKGQLKRPGRSAERAGHHDAGIGFEFRQVGGEAG